MAKRIFEDCETDLRVVRYLSDSVNPVSLNYINRYSIERSADGSAWLNVRIWLDMDRFEEPLPEKEE